MILKKNIEVKSFGSLFFDEIPQVIGAQYSGEDFFIGDSVKNGLRPKTYFSTLRGRSWLHGISLEATPLKSMVSIISVAS